MAYEVPYTVASAFHVCSLILRMYSVLYALTLTMEATVYSTAHVALGRKKVLPWSHRQKTTVPFVPFHSNPILFRVLLVPVTAYPAG